MAYSIQKQIQMLTIAQEEIESTIEANNFISEEYKKLYIETNKYLETLIITKRRQLRGK